MVADPINHINPSERVPGLGKVHHRRFARSPDPTQAVFAGLQYRASSSIIRHESTHRDVVAFGVREIGGSTGRERIVIITFECERETRRSLVHLWCIWGLHENRVNKIYGDKPCSNGYP